MCTAISFHAGEHYFGRNLDLEYSYDEQIVITPRQYPFFFGNGEAMTAHYAMIGTAYVSDGYPLYYDGMNEKGLAMAALAFPGEAVYHENMREKLNITPYELIPYILGKCDSVKKARLLLKNISLLARPFCEELPLTPLHFIISDQKESLTAEPTEKGLLLYDNPFGVLTNSPSFDFHIKNLQAYMALSAEPMENRLSETLPFSPYSRGMGALGLPGDLSSPSRFVRAVFMKENALSSDTEEGNVHQFFHLLDSVKQIRGCVRIGEKYEYTVYSSCCNTAKGIYYYTAYENRVITGIDMNQYPKEGSSLLSFPLLKKAPLHIISPSSLE